MLLLIMSEEMVSYFLGERVDVFCNWFYVELVREVFWGIVLLLFYFVYLGSCIKVIVS